MAEKKIKYVEPSSYFTPEMLKAAKEWDKQHKAEVKKNTTKKK